jgi:hypothetical protein
MFLGSGFKEKKIKPRNLNDSLASLGSAKPIKIYDSVDSLGSALSSFRRNKEIEKIAGQVYRKKTSERQLKKIENDKKMAEQVIEP